MKLHLSFLLIDQHKMMPEATYWSDDDNSQLSVIAGAGAVEMDDDGGCWYRCWAPDHGLSHEEELEHLPDNDDTTLTFIISHLRKLAKEVDERYE